MARIALALGLLLLGGVAHPMAGDGAVRLSVAASIAPAVERAAREYRGTHPEVAIELNAGASGVLVQQIRSGAPVDALIAASPAELDRLAAEGLLAEPSRRRLASNRLVIVVPGPAPPPGDVRQLAGPSYSRIAIGNPRTAPLGRFTRQALERAGVWEALGPRLVYGENARQVLEYAARGDVDAAVVYRTDAAMAPGRVAAGAALSADLHDAIVYEAAVIRGAEHGRAAGDFIDWLAAEGGRRVLAEAGFTPP